MAAPIYVSLDAVARLMAVDSVADSLDNLNPTSSLKFTMQRVIIHSTCLLLCVLEWTGGEIVWAPAVRPRPRCTSFAPFAPFLSSVSSPGDKCIRPRCTSDLRPRLAHVVRAWPHLLRLRLACVPCATVCRVCVLLTV